MSRKPKLERKHLLGVVAEFGSAFRIKSLVWKSRFWVRSIILDPKRIAVLPIGGGRCLVWTREGGEWSIVLQTFQSRTEVQGSLRDWTEMPCTAGLRKKRVAVKLSPHTLRVEEVVWGADEGMLPPDNSQNKR